MKLRAIYRNEFGGCFYTNVAFPLSLPANVCHDSCWICSTVSLNTHLVADTLAWLSKLSLNTPWICRFKGKSQVAQNEKLLM